MPYLTDKQLNDVLDLPVSLPASQLKADTWLVLASVRLVSPQKLTYRHLQLQLLDFTANGDIVYSDSARGLVYVAIFKDYDVSQRPGGANSPVIPQGSNQDLIVASDVGIISRDQSIPLDLTASGDYSFVIVNNTTNVELRAAVNGQIRLALNPV
jgi:hypothetical protein